MTDLLDGAAAAFGLGRPEGAAPVTGGLSHDLWRLETGRGVFAVKVMRAHADAPDFRDNIEAAHAVEARAFAHGIRCPEPVLSDAGLCLTEVGGQPVRAHRWCEGRVPLPQDWQCEPWDEARWADLASSPDLPAALADLDPKNTLVVDGALMALDWDAAGPRSVLREAVYMALDWSTDVPGFRRVLACYCRASGTTVVDELWPFGGWVSALGGWLVHNATSRAHTDLGRREVATTCDRLLALHASLPDYRDALTTAQR